MKQTITIKEIAKMAGVSTATVSVALSGKVSASTRISKQTRDRVVSLAREHNYKPNLAAKGFHQKKTYLIGFFFNDSSSFVMMRLLDELRRYCYDHSYDIILYPSSSLEMERRSIESARSRNLDGVITIPFASEEGDNARYYRQFLSDGIPVVQLIYSISDEFDFVGRDYYSAGQKAVRILQKHGHRRLGLVMYDNYLDPKLGCNSYHFYEGARHETEKAGAELQIYPIELPQEPNSFPGGSEGEKILKLPAGRQPTALFSNSNTLLYKISGVFRFAGKRIPEDISFLGCGEDLELPRSLLPGMSTLGTPFRSLIRAAAAKIIQPDSREAAGRPEFESPFYRGSTIAEPGGSSGEKNRMSGSEEIRR